MAFAVLPNQGRFPISDELLKLRDDSQQAKEERDARVRRVIGQYAPAALNATLTYETEGEAQIVRVTPNLGRKASSVFESVHQTLISAPRYIDPALALAWEIKWRYLTGNLNPAQLVTYRPRLDQMLGQGSKRYDRPLDNLHITLSRAEGILPHEAPIGF